MERVIRILVTGATGYLGRHLTQSLIGQGAEVHVLARPKSVYPLELKGAQTHKYDGSSMSILKAVELSQPEIVYHLAANYKTEHGLTDIADLCQSNITFGSELVEAMIQNGTRKLVAAGTSWQNFDGKQGVGSCFYAATKQAFESILAYYSDARGLQTIVLKIFDTYGPRDDRRKLLRLIREAARLGQAMDLSPGEQRLHLLHVDDIVSAFKKAAETFSGVEGFTREYYLPSTKALSIRELVEIYNEVSPKKLHANWGSRGYRKREVMEPWSKGPTLPGWRPQVELSAGLRDYANEEY